MTLTEFLLARIAEDEERAQYDTPHWADCEHFIMFQEGGLPCTCGLEARMLAECAAKRRVIDEINSLEAQIDSEWGVGPMDENSIPGLQALAQPYADHPDYQPEWVIASPDP
jgi:hypothetical protein